MLSLSIASFASSGVCFSPLGMACIIEIARSSIRIAPPTLNNAIVMPKNASNGCPPIAATINTMATEMLATKAICFLSSALACAVMTTNMGTAPKGLTITSSARKNLVYSAQSSICTRFLLRRVDCANYHGSDITLSQPAGQLTASRLTRSAGYLFRSDQQHRNACHPYHLFGIASHNKTFNAAPSVSSEHD